MKMFKVAILSLFLGRLLMASYDITSYVSRAEVSHNSKMMAVTSYADKKHTISLWSGVDNLHFVLLKKYDFRDDDFFSENIAFSNDDKYLVAGADSNVYIWDTKSYKVVKKIELKNEVSAVRFSHNGKYLIVGEQLNNVYVFDAKNNFNLIMQLPKTQKKPKSNFETKIYDIKFSLDDKYAVISYAKQNAEIYSVDQNFTKIKTFNNRDDFISETHFTTDGEYLITSSNANEMEIYTPTPPFKKIKTIEKNGEKDIYIVSLSKNNRYYLTSWDYAGKINVWDIKNGFKKIAILDGHKEYTTHLQFFNNDKYFLSAGGDNKIKIWDTKSKKVVCELFLTEHNGFKTKCKYHE